MIGLPKNRLDLENPQLLQHPLFRGLRTGIIFMDNSKFCRDLVRKNGSTTLSSTAPVWSYSEYGWQANMSVGSGIITGWNSIELDWQNFTFMVWASTISTLTTRENLMGCKVATAEEIRFGRNSDNFYFYVRTPSETRIMSNDIANHNDGNIHCFGGTSAPTGCAQYFDGVQTGTALAATSNLGDVTDWVEIGDNGAGDEWEGDITLALGWDRGLSAEEMNLLYRMGPNLTLVNDRIEMPYYGALGTGAATFNAAWAYNSNQVL